MFYYICKNCNDVQICEKTINNFEVDKQLGLIGAFHGKNYSIAHYLVTKHKAVIENEEYKKLYEKWLFDVNKVIDVVYYCLKDVPLELIEMIKDFMV